VIWYGDLGSALQTITDKVRFKFFMQPEEQAHLPLLFRKYNRRNNKSYIIREMAFPKTEPYGWNNYPYDYYNIWVKNAGEDLYMEEPSLEMLTKDNQVIIFKHCFPVSNVQPDPDSANINSDYKSLANYKLQYLAIRDKLHQFPMTKFIVFTGAVQVKYYLPEEEAIRAREFNDWVRLEWDQPDDNIYLWDLYELQTEGGLYFKDEYAVSGEDSHPNITFAGKAADLLFSRIIDIIESNGNTTLLTGESR
jgi:hypothetical protein